MRNLPLAALGVALVTAACADTPTDTLEQTRPALGVGTFGSPTARAGGAASSAIVVDPGDPNTITYTFDDLPYNCYWDAVMPNPYEDLTFITTPYLAACGTPNFTMGLIPANSAAGSVDQVSEVKIQLPHPASSISMQAWAYNGPLTLIAYDASGAVLATATGASDSYFYGGETVTVSAAGIDKLGISTLQNAQYLDNLKITYKLDPTNKNQCKDGGYVAFGFKNQGQCVRFTENGRDSR